MQWLRHPTHFVSMSGLHRTYNVLVHLLFWLAVIRMQVQPDIICSGKEVVPLKNQLEWCSLVLLTMSRIQHYNCSLQYSHIALMPLFVFAFHHILELNYQLFHFIPGLRTISFRCWVWRENQWRKNESWKVRLIIVNMTIITFRYILIFRCPNGLNFASGQRWIKDNTWSQFNVFYPPYLVVNVAHPLLTLLTFFLAFLFTSSAILFLQLQRISLWLFSRFLLIFLCRSIASSKNNIDGIWRWWISRRSWYTLQ